MVDKTDITSFSGEYSFLSNFYPCRIKFEGFVYASVEAAFVAGKTTDETIREQIRQINDPGKIKKFGRTFKLRDNWDEQKLNFMYKLVKYKFTHNEKLKELLLSTAGKQLIEGNYWNDTYWGVCLKTNKGYNNLGILLMKIRDELNNNN